MNKWLLIPALLFLISCNGGSTMLSTRPSGVISKSKMVDVLVDINLAEAALRVGTPSHNQPADTLYQKSQFIKVFEKNEVNPDDFTTSLNYYTEHVEELNEIYLEVIDRLTSMQANLEGNKTPKKQNAKTKK
jgi:hypothetical protein